MVNDYWVSAIFMPFLIYAIAAIGLNILTGYCGQVSLGTGGFMAVGAYACYKLMTAFPDVSMLCMCCWRADYGWCRCSVWLAVAAHQRVLSGGGDTWRRSSFWCGCSTACRGFTTIRRRVRSTRRSVKCSGSDHGTKHRAWATYMFCLSL